MMESASINSIAFKHIMCSIFCIVFVLSRHFDHCSYSHIIEDEAACGIQSQNNWFKQITAII